MSLGIVSAQFANSPGKCGTDTHPKEVSKALNSDFREFSFREEKRNKLLLKMKVFIVGSVLLLATVASAHYWHYVPADTPEVAAAKAEHFAAHQAARGHVGAGPIDTPEVQHAKAQHFAAHAAARAGHPGAAAAPAWHAAPAAHAWHGAGAWHGPQHIPVIHNGVPVETPEVQHAKAAHLAALHSAGSGAHWAPAGHEDDGSYKPQWDAHNY